MKWGEFLQERTWKEKKSRENDGETCEPEEREGAKEGGQDRFWGGKLVAQWGFLLEFNLFGWGRKRRREGNGPGQRQYGICVD